MRLTNFEFFANTGVAVVGATVTPYAASDVHPNPNGPATTSVTTDTNGRWDFPSLADGQLYDVKVAFGTSVKWYKGNARLALGHLYDDTTPPPNRNLLENGGADLWLLRGSGALSLPTSEPGVDNEADAWAAYCGAGDVCTAQMDTATRMTNSRASSRMTYVRAGGQAVRQYALADGIWQQLRGQPFAVSAQVLQVTASSRLYVAIDDGVTETVGTITDVVGAWTTISCLKTISASATKVVVRIRTNRTDTGSRVFHVDNVMGDQTSLVPVFAPEAGDNALVAIRSQHTVLEAAPAVDTAPVGVLLNNLAARVRDIIGAGGADWKDAIPRSLTQLIADDTLRVLKAGDVMTGTLQVQSHLTVAPAPSVAGDLSLYEPSGVFFWLLQPAAGVLNLLRSGSGAGLSLNLGTGQMIWLGGRIWTAADAPSFAGALSAASASFAGALVAGGALTVPSATINGAAGITGNLTVGGTIGATGAVASAGTVQGTRLLSTQGPGLSPLVVNSNTLVNGLNSQYLQGFTPSGTPAPNAIPVADAFGKLDAWVTPSGGGSGTPIPSGLIAAFATAGEIPSGWTRYNALDGRLPVGAGQVGENSFNENSAYGTSWAHTHIQPAHGHTQPSHTHSGASLGIGGTATGTPSGTGTGGGTGATFADASHTHGVGNFDVTGSTDTTAPSVDTTVATINSTTLLLPMRAVVWARKS